MERSMNLFKEYLKTLILSLSAGICIGIGGTVYLMCESKPLGAFLFAVGLTTILIFGFNLFTGMVGYTFDNKPMYLVKLLVVWIGNFGGTVAVGLIMSLTRVGGRITEAAKAVTASKLSDNYLSLFVLGIFCGILMFVGVDCFKKTWEKKDFASIFMPVVCVAVFILSSFEHCIADMFYFAAAGQIIEGLPTLLFVTLGNSLGGVLFALVRRAATKLSA
jgi:formate/nitrite transporter FocA (FNT family)